MKIFSSRLRVRLQQAGALYFAFIEVTAQRYVYKIIFVAASFMHVHGCLLLAQSGRNMRSMKEIPSTIKDRGLNLYFFERFLENITAGGLSTFSSWLQDF